MYLLPRPVLEQLQLPNAAKNLQAGFCGEHCWVLSSDCCWVWRYQENQDARLRTLRLPGKASALLGQKCFVSVLSSAQTTTVLLCFSSGLLVAWLDASYLTDPTTQQLVEFSHGGAVTAFAACCPDLAASPGFIAAVATSQGHLLTVQGSQQGIYAKQVVGSVAPKESRGMFGALGNAISWTYHEAFDPSAKFVKRSSSGRPACGVHVQTVDALHIHVLVLTDSSLDCWLVTLGMRPSEQLLWSYQNLLASQNERKLHGAVNAAMTVAGSLVYVRVHDQPRDDSPALFINRIAIKPDAPPVHDYCLPVEGLPASEADVSSAPGYKVGIHASEEHNAVLLVGQDATLYQWAGHQGHSGSCTAVVVAEDPDTLAAAAALPLHRGPASAPDTAWVVLNATCGLMELGLSAGATAQGAGGAPGSRPAGPMTHEQQLQAHQVLDTLVTQAVTMAQQQQPLHSLAAGLRRRLEVLGVMEPLDNTQAIATYSTELVDMLPKQWALGGLAAAHGSGSAAGLMNQLIVEKEVKHSLLLQCLADSGVLFALPADVLRVLVENSEKLAVASSVLALQVAVHAELASGSQSDTIIKVVHLAGQLCSGGTHETLPPTELFYARPSISVPALLQAVGQAADSISQQTSSGLARPEDEGVHQLHQHSSDLGRLLGTAVAAAHAKRDALQSGLRVSTPQIYSQLGHPSWLADQAARGALERLSLACQAVRRLLLGSGGAGSQAPVLDLARTAFGVTEVLLAGFAAAVAAAPSPPAKAALVADYKAARARCVATLLEDASMELAGSAAAGLPAGDALVWQVEDLAAAHHCFQQLFDVCELFARGSADFAVSRLHQHMAAVGAEEGVPQTETFARYCYQRFLDEQRPADLLTLPAAFHADMKAFLLPRPEHASLLWPLLLHTGDFVGGTEALVLDATAHKGSLPEHQRLVSLARLAATASGDSAAEAAATEQLQLVRVQEGINNFLAQVSPGEPPAQGVMDITGVVDAALAAEQGAGSGEGALLALQALATCSPEARDANLSKYQLAWQGVCAATKWSEVDSALEAAGPGDATAAVLENTPLYHAVALCCGQGVFGIGASVTDTAPIMQVRQWISQLTSADRRAEAISSQIVELALQNHAAEQAQ